MFNVKIAFATHLSEIINHFRSILGALPPGATIVDCAPAGSAESMRIRELAIQEACVVQHMDDMPSDGPSFDVLVTIHMQIAPWKEGNTVPGVLGWAKRHARLCYGLGKTAWNLSDWNHFYDLILCFGPYQQKMFRYVFPGIEVRTVGYPRFDTFDPHPADRKARIRKLGGDPSKKCVVWLPTYSTLSSIPAYSERIAALTGAFNVFVKVHPGTPWLESERMALLRQQGFTALIAGDFDNVRLFELADYVLADYGGSAFGAIYTNRNLLLLNKPGDLFAEDTGWLSADIQLRDDFISVNPNDYIDIQRLLDDDAIWREQEAVRANYRALLFSAPPGLCGAAAAGFLLDLGKGAIKAPDRTLQPRVLPEAFARIRKLPQEGYQYPWKGTYQWAKDEFKNLNRDLKREQQENATARAAIRSLETEAGTLKTAHTTLKAQLERTQEELAQIRVESLHTAEALCALKKEYEVLKAAHSTQVPKGRKSTEALRGSRRKSS